MNLVTLSFAKLKARPLNTALNLALLALAIATIVLVVLVSAQLEERLARDGAGIDLVVGAKGSSTQLVLSAVYELDAPTLAIPLSEAQRIGVDLAVRFAIPLALADNYWGYRIVGTTPAYASHYGARMNEGRLWEAPYEAVVGADVASRMRLAVGSTFTAAHGVRDARADLHADTPYRVVGVLARNGTVLDRLVLTDVSSVTRTHGVDRKVESSDLVMEPPEEDPAAITALLLQCISPEAASTLAKRINAETNLQATAPTAEIDRLFAFIGVGREMLWGFAILLVLAAAVSSFIALYDALSERRQELAIMRVLGAGPRRLMAILLVEGLLLASTGGVLGLALGHAFTAALGAALIRSDHVSVTGWTWYPAELGVLGLTVAVGLAAALFPAWRARRIDIAATLARN